MPMFSRRKAAKGAAQKVMSEAGWSQKHEWRVPRDGAAPLYFSLRIPDQTRLLDVSELAAQVGDRIPQGMRSGVSALDQMEGEPGTICSGAIVHEDNPEIVMVVLTVGLALGVRGLPDVDELAVSTAGEEVQRFVTPISEKAVLLDRVTMLALKPGEDPSPMMLHQYLMETRYGALSFAFTSTNRAMFSENGRRMMSEISQTGWLGETDDIV